MGFCTVGLCPVGFCPVGLCPVGFCPTHYIYSETENISYSIQSNINSKFEFQNFQIKHILSNNLANLGILLFGLIFRDQNGMLTIHGTQ